jgi:hypothetical protein
MKIHTTRTVLHIYEYLIRYDIETYLWWEWIDNDCRGVLNVSHYIDRYR